MKSLFLSSCLLGTLLCNSSPTLSSEKPSIKELSIKEPIKKVYDKIVDGYVDPGDREPAKEIGHAAIDLNIPKVIEKAIFTPTKTASRRDDEILPIPNHDANDQPPPRQPINDVKVLNDNFGVAIKHDFKMLNDTFGAAIERAPAPASEPRSHEGTMHEPGSHNRGDWAGPDAHDAAVERAGHIA